MVTASREHPTTEIIGGIQPQLESTLRQAWERLFWEPQIAVLGPGRMRVNGYTVDRNTEGLNENSIFVSPEGKLFQADWYKISEVGLATYLTYAPKTEESLVRLREEQLREIDEAQEGKDILWRPGTWLGIKDRSFYYADTKPYGNNIPETKVLTVHVRNYGPPHGSPLRMPYNFYCPEHPKNGRLKMTYFPEDRNMLFVACSFNSLPDREGHPEQGHFAVYSGTREDHSWYEG